MIEILKQLNKDNTLVPLHWNEDVQICETKNAEYIILRVNVGSEFMETLEELRLEANLEDITGLVFDLAKEKIEEISFSDEVRHEFFERCGYLDES